MLVATAKINTGMKSQSQVCRRPLKPQQLSTSKKMKVIKIVGKQIDINIDETTAIINPRITYV
jgi:hypothetical protein